MPRQNNNQKILDAGFVQDSESGLYFFQGGNTPHTKAGALAIINRDASYTDEPNKRVRVSTPKEVIEVSKKISQYYSTGMKITGQWGSEEIDMRLLRGSIVAAFEGDTVYTVDEKVATNAIASLKRSKTLQACGKGKLCVGEIAATDWKSFR